MNIRLRLSNRLLNLLMSASGLLMLMFASQLHGVEFDHSYNRYDKLLKEVVQVADDNKQTRVNYPQLAVRQGILDAILQPFSAVHKNQFDRWSQDQQISFLINAYNGFTLKLIVDNWDEFKRGDAKSIRDLGSLFTTPWEKKFFTLFAQQHSLDDVEHQMLRKWFTQPRIHAALVCAAVSCPPLRNEAYLAEHLRQQLDNQMKMFLADNSRNQILTNGQAGKASLSSIFKWYRQDFEQGDAGFNSLFDLLNTYREALVDGDDDQQAQRKIIDSGNYPIIFKDYDWRLNNVATF